MCEAWEIRVRVPHRSFSSSRRSSHRCPASRDNLASGETSASPPVEDSLDIVGLGGLVTRVVLVNFLSGVINIEYLRGTTKPKPFEARIRAAVSALELK